MTAGVTSGEVHPLPSGTKPTFDVNFARAAIDDGTTRGTHQVTGLVHIKADGVEVGQQTVKIAAPNLAGTYKIKCEQVDRAVGDEILLGHDWEWLVSIGTGSQPPPPESYPEWELVPTSDKRSYFLKNVQPGKQNMYLEAVG
jgi:hypothetical protein